MYPKITQTFVRIIREQAFYVKGEAEKTKGPAEFTAGPESSFGTGSPKPMPEPPTSAWCTAVLCGPA